MARMVLPYDAIRDHRHLLPDDEETSIVLYCRSGGTSRQVTKPLLDLAYEEIRYLRGGVRAWKSGISQSPSTGSASPVPVPLTKEVSGGEGRRYSGAGLR